jgi:pRiA4b ORF-3-like protein
VQTDARSQRIHAKSIAVGWAVLGVPALSLDVSRGTTAGGESSGRVMTVRRVAGIMPAGPEPANARPEDCGGIPGFYETLDAAADPKHPNHAEAKKWLDDYDPNLIDELPIKYALGRTRTSATLPRFGSPTRNHRQLRNGSAAAPRAAAP